MASALLTLLYPDEFTVYDYRVCEMLDGFRVIGRFKSGQGGAIQYGPGGGLIKSLAFLSQQHYGPLWRRRSHSRSAYENYKLQKLKCTRKGYDSLYADRFLYDRLQRSSLQELR